MRYAAIFISLLLFFGCSDKEKISQLEQKTAQLEATNKLLAEQSIMKDEFIEEYTKTINEVYDDLERIRKREGFITKYSKNVEKDKEASVKEKMLNNIASIDSYIKNSKKKLKKLKETMNYSKMKTSLLEETIEKLKTALDEKEKHIAELKKQVEQLNVRVTEVEGQLKEKDEVIENQTRRMNTAFYVIGTNKELKGKNIIDETGGFLGIGKTKIVASNLNNEHFTSTNIMTTDSISIQQDIDDIKIISPHNPDSFHLVKKDEKQTVLEIIDPEEFWKMKYLVILAQN